MPISFSCEDCGKGFKVASSNVGRKTKCPACGAMLIIPTRSTVEDIANTILDSAPPPSTAPTPSPSDVVSEATGEYELEEGQTHSRSATEDTHYVAPPPPPAAGSAALPARERQPLEIETRYLWTRFYLRVLDFFALLFFALAALCLAIGIVSPYLLVFDEGLSWTQRLAPVGTGIIVAFWLSLFGLVVRLVNELTRVVLDIEENTRRAAMVAERQSG